MSNKYYLFTNQLTEEEHRVIVSIVKHIENGARRVGIQQIEYSVCKVHTFR